MKKLTALSLFLFWAFITAILTAGLLINENKAPTDTTSTNAQSSALTLQEIAKHATAASCWLLIDGKVYDVTSYLDLHPGGAKTILPTCGTDATKAYVTKGKSTKPTAHSQGATALLKKYYIGDLNQIAHTPISSFEIQETGIVQQQPVTQTPTTGTTVTLSASEVATHNTTANCWMIINGKIYDVTSYIPRHPGGTSAIASYCGKDGTAAFEGLPHSANAHQLLATYLVGSIGQTTTVKPAQPTPTTPTGGRNDDDAWDDD